jgi:hypothetical protein
MSAAIEASPAPTDWSPRTLGRVIAVLFIVVLVLGVIAQGVISERLVSFRDAALTASNILSHEALYRAGFTLYMLEMAAQIGQTVLMYHLLKPVNRRLATLALVFGLVGCTVKIFSRVLYLAPLFVLQQGALTALTGDQRNALSLVLLKVNDSGAAVAMLLFGFQTLIEGWLVFRSTFLPRWLGVLVMACGAGWLTFLWPPLGYAAFNMVALFALVVSALLIGWLFKGVDEQRWRALAAESGAR